jgi:amidase
MDDAVATWPATRLAEAIAKRDLSSRELLALYLDRIERLDGPVNAVVTFDVERAQAAATAADEATAAGRAGGPLHGLPITVKDAIATEGIRSTGGAVELTDHVPDDDAPAVARLKRAGAVVFAKTNLPRWSGDLQTYNDLFGTTSNPWDVRRTPGGSSGGAAAAVACGFTSFELGTDIGGSVRMPSHFCGVFGLKPSYGVVSQRGYLDSIGGGTTDVDINVFGPIARSADDLDLLLDVLAGPPPEQAVAWRLDLPAAEPTSLAGLRIGVWFDDPVAVVQRDYRALLEATAGALTDAGADVREDHPAVELTDQRDTFMNLIQAAIGPSMPEDIAEAVTGSHLAWLGHDRHRAELRARWAAWFERFDVLLCPVAVTPAFPHDQEGDILSRTLEIDGVERPMIDDIVWNGLIGVVGLPSAVPPIGRTPDGLPCGVQVVAPYLHDRRAVRVAGLVADATGGGYVPPPGFGPA